MNNKNKMDIFMNEFINNNLGLLLLQLFTVLYCICSTKNKNQGILLESKIQKLGWIKVVPFEGTAPGALSELSCIELMVILSTKLMRRPRGSPVVIYYEYHKKEGFKLVL